MRVLGPVELYDPQGNPVPVGGLTQTILLALLAVEANRPVPGQRLVELMWPERAPANPTAALYNQASRLRRTLRRAGLALVSQPPAGYLLRIEPDELDATAFEDAVRRTDPSRVAPERLPEVIATVLEPWRGEPYLGLHAVGPVRHEAQRLVDVKLSWLERAAARLAATGQGPAAVAHLRRLVAEAPLRERPQLLLISALAATGGTAAAVGQYHSYRELLARETGLSPTPEAERAYRRLLDGTIPVAPAGMAPPQMVPPTAGMAPVPVPEASSPIIGRQREVEELAAFLARGHRLVTLTGPGGVGKTRLATELAHRAWRDESAFADLAAAGGHDAPVGDVVDPVARALGVHLATGDPVGNLVTAIGDTRLLLLVDNAEQAPPCAALVARLVASCRNLYAVVTSRERLGVTGETEYAVPPLSVPPAEPAGGTGLPDVLAYPAAALFADRLVDRAVLSAADDRVLARQIGRLCQQLGGLPLALELAAGLARSRSLDELFDALVRSLDTAAAAGADPGGRALAAALRWSCERLTGTERRLLRLLATFAGACDAVTAGRLAGVDPPALDAAVARLVALGLVLVRRDGIPVGYTVPPIVAAYVHRQLSSPAERSAAEAAHLRHHAARCRDPRWLDSDLLALIDSGYEDFLRALRRAVAGPDGGEPLADLAVAMGLYWLWRSDIHQGLGWLDRLERRLAGDPLATARLRVLRTGFLREIGRGREAAELAAGCQEALRAAGDAEWLVTNLLLLAITANDQGPPVGDAHWAEAAVEVAREAVPRRQAEALGVLSAVRLMAGADAAAAEAALAALGQLDECRSPALRSEIRANAAQTLTETGRPLLALEVLTSGLADLGDFAAGVQGYHVQLGWARLGSGDPSGALAEFRTGLHSALPVGQWIWVADALGGAACALAQLGRTRPAALALGGAERLLRRVGIQPSRWARGQLDAAYRLVVAAPSGRDLIEAGGQLAAPALIALTECE